MYRLSQRWIPSRRYEESFRGKNISHARGRASPRALRPEKLRVTFYLFPVSHGYVYGVFSFPSKQLARFRDVTRHGRGARFSNLRQIIGTSRLFPPLNRSREAIDQSERDTPRYSGMRLGHIACAMRGTSKARLEFAAHSYALYRLRAATRKSYPRKRDDDDVRLVMIIIRRLSAPSRALCVFRHGVYLRIDRLLAVVSARVVTRARFRVCVSVYA